MNITLTGSLGWIFNLCVLTTAAIIIILGTFTLISTVIVWMIEKVAMQLNIWKHFAEYVYNRKRFKCWMKEHKKTGLLNPAKPYTCTAMKTKQS
jgi:hypothetical protein